jgi:hypothetical protein
MRVPNSAELTRTVAHLPTMLARTAGEDGTGVCPGFVRRQFEAYLRCGILLRVRCERCGEMSGIGFSCKGRGFCPRLRRATAVSRSGPGTVGTEVSRTTATANTVPDVDVSERVTTRQREERLAG